MKKQAMNSIISNLKQGINWVSSSNPVRGGVIVTFAAFFIALIKDGNFDKLLNSGLSLFSNKKNPSQKLLFVPGLQNLGNNCFLNVILQALASCSHFGASLQKVIRQCDSSFTAEWSQSFHLTAALDSLLQELSAFDEEPVVLSPRKVMFAMAEYIQNFNLTSEQDAEEAFIYLLSSLRKEFSDSYPANQSSLADAFASSNCRILAAERMEIQNEQERWQQHFLGPFDGTLSSILTCQSCSSQISLNFQFFHSLPLLPVLERASTIMAGCALEDCLKQFIIAEQVENYNCSNCWHIAALKYLSLQGAKEKEIEKLRRCSLQDSCTCPSLSDLGNLPRSCNYSRTLKQLSVARCPKILCIHLQRASINQFGELVKLQGHVRFPLILDMLPFTMEKLQCQKLSHHLNNFNFQPDSTMLNWIYGQSTRSKVSTADGLRCSDNKEAFAGESSLPQNNGCSNVNYVNLSFQANKKTSSTCPEPVLYRLVSVVEHFGKTGGGHYTVYRSVRSESLEYNNENLNTSSRHWFSISDSEVHSVSEEDVVAAEASLLFYERIM